MNDFLNPKSMLTPGVAGALVMFISNGFATAFEINSVFIKWIALAISFLLGLFLFNATNRQQNNIATLLVLYVLNSSIIFCTAFGSNSIGKKLSNNIPTQAPSETSVNSAKSYNASFYLVILEDTSLKWRTDTLKQKKSIRTIKRNLKNNPSPKSQSFFKEW